MNQESHIPSLQSSAADDVLIRAHALTKVYDGVRAVDSIDLSVSRGETFGLLGPNGAGKSTTMRMIACRTPPTSGQLFVEGIDVYTHPRRIRSLIGVVAQENNLDPDLSVRQNLLVYARYFRLPSEIARSRCDEMLGIIGLGARSNARVDQLSGGMKRRLMIARALLHQPRLLVLDEPTTGLDPQVRQEIWQRLEELRRHSGVTILLSTHYMEEAEKLCERLLVIDKGRILATGAPRDLIRARVSSYALEVREAAPLSLLPLNNNELSAVERGGAHFYFAPGPELLTPLMKHYEGRRMLIRPSNLEDVFLQLVGDGDLQTEGIN
ncbi:MAG TPA: ABC transporter ATP-binding protein [Pyrinomonadaceae bacterium]|nr:ABC transporter ATP-binding protein [Pyrinomonadaceae bacterium]